MNWSIEVQEAQLAVDDEKVEFWCIDVENDIHTRLYMHIFSFERKHSRRPGGRVGPVFGVTERNWQDRILWALARDALEACESDLRDIGIGAIDDKLKLSDLGLIPEPVVSSSPRGGGLEEGLIIDLSAKGS